MPRGHAIRSPCLHFPGVSHTYFPIAICLVDSFFSCHPNPRARLQKCPSILWPLSGLPGPWDAPAVAPQPHICPVPGTCLLIQARHSKETEVNTVENRDMLGVNCGPGTAGETGEQPRPSLSSCMHFLTLDMLEPQSGRMAQSAKLLPNNCEDLTVGSQLLHKNLGAVARHQGGRDRRSPGDASQTV